MGSQINFRLFESSPGTWGWIVDGTDRTEGGFASPEEAMKRALQYFSSNPVQLNDKSQRIEPGAGHLGTYWACVQMPGEWMLVEYNGKTHVTRFEREGGRLGYFSSALGKFSWKGDKLEAMQLFSYLRGGRV